jgi:peptidoglycan lytic transglycosylase
MSNPKGMGIAECYSSRCAMQYLFRGSTSFIRVSVLALMAALLSAQGCAIIADTPKLPESTKETSPAASKTGNLPANKAPTPIYPRETPSIAKVPSPPKTEPPPIAKIPEPSERTMMETGLASWYGPKFHGKLTASGEVFDQEQFTAAHRTLPWGSRVRVTNLVNGKSVDLRINDRGPFGKGRIIDVSRAAARALGMVRQGLTTVQIESLSDSAKSNELVLQNK